LRAITAGRKARSAAFGQLGNLALLLHELALQRRRQGK
jgi:hypothetical protein